MKATALVFVFLSSFAAFGQGTVSSSMQRPDTGMQGFSIGMEYMNVSDVHTNIQIKSNYGSSSASSEGGTSLGMAGVRLGYNNTPEQGLGFDIGVRYLESFNKSEYGEDKLKVIMPELNGKLSLVRSFAIYAGLNVSKWMGSNTIEKYQPRLGGQAGLSFRFTNSVAMNAGYTMMNQNYSDSNSNSTFNADLLASGFNTNLNYTF